MKRCFAIVFLSVFLITYFIPVTSVFATEVTWGENNSYYITDTQFNNLRNIAALDIIPQLTSNGVNSLTINNANDIDDFIINLLDYIDENAESTVSDIYSVCNELKDAIDEKANEVGYFMKQLGVAIPDQSMNLTEMLSYTSNLPKFDVKLNPNFTHLFNRLSLIDNPSDSPTPPADYSFIGNINYLFMSSNVTDFFSDLDFYVKYQNYNWGVSSPVVPLRQGSYFIFNTYDGYKFHTISALTNSNDKTPLLGFSDTVGTIRITTNYDDEVSVTYENFDLIEYWQFWNNVSTRDRSILASCFYDTNFGAAEGKILQSINNSNYHAEYLFRNDYVGFGSAINDIYNRYCNVNIFVNGEQWVGVPASSNDINLNVNGIEFYSDNTKKPIQYYYPHGTKIDYNKLYLVIKTAIEDSLPISQTTINEGDVYYDSHDTVYSPTIYNYYSDDSDNEEDVLSDIIDIATIPKFDTALLAPIEEPLTNGTVIMINSVHALPEDILFVLGAAFVLILFVAMINRLIE